MRSVHSAVMTDALFSMLYTVYVYLLPVYCALDTGEQTSSCLQPPFGDEPPRKVCWF